MMDSISTGLDSAATFDICKTLRACTRALDANIVVCLLQPPPEVRYCFTRSDWVLHIEDSYQLRIRTIWTRRPNFDICKTLRACTRALDANIVVCLLQPPPEVRY
jgi:hypothetical protein